MTRKLKNKKNKDREAMNSHPKLVHVGMGVLVYARVRVEYQKGLG